MRKVVGFLDGINVNLNVPETLFEFSEGARLSEGNLAYNEGYLFNFNKTMNIVMENTGVVHDLAIIYFPSLIKFGIVSEMSSMEKNSSKQVASIGFYSVALELRQDFIKDNRIKQGSILVLKEELKKKNAK